MDENKEEKSTQYTGEYGNSVEGNYQEEGSSVYSYSYNNKNSETTHSGDYYESKNTADSQSTQSAAENEQAGYQKSGYNQSNNGQTGYQQGGYNQSNNGQTGYQQGGYNQSGNGQTGYQQGGYNQSGNGQTGYQQNGYDSNGNGSGYRQGNYYRSGNFQNNENPKKPKKNRKPREKKPLTFGKKVGLVAAAAVLFGLVAGICFNAVNYVSNRVLGDNGSTSGTSIATTSTGNVATSSAIGTNDVSAITEQTMPAVVAITSTTEGTAYYDLFGQYNKGQDSTSAGSGFIVGQNKKELLIATNNHVIDGAKTISVQFIDGEVYEATEKGADSSNDLAVVAVKTSKMKKSTMDKIKIADLGSSDDIKVGEMVIAIGNALGYGQSVTVGYISAKDREITESSETSSKENKIKAIQTDAAINPGNSGGALINMKGQVVGINSAKIASSSVEGVGYAIPISVATPIIDELMNRETLNDSQKGYLGITGSTVSEAATAYNVPYGVYVKEVAKGGAADKGGIKANDVITAVNKMEVTTMESLQEKVNSYKKGTEITITLQRRNNGKYTQKKVKVTLQGKESLDSLSTDDSSSADNSQDSQNNNGQNGYNRNNGQDNDQNDGNSDSGSLWDQFFN